MSGGPMKCRLAIIKLLDEVEKLSGTEKIVLSSRLSALADHIADSDTGDPAVSALYEYLSTFVNTMKGKVDP